MNLQELKLKTPGALLEFAEPGDRASSAPPPGHDVRDPEAAGRERHNVFGDGVLEILRTASASSAAPGQLPGPDDIYMARPGQALALRTGTRSRARSGHRKGRRAVFRPPSRSTRSTSRTGQIRHHQLRQPDAALSRREAHHGARGQGRRGNAKLVDEPVTPRGDHAGQKDGAGRQPARLRKPVRAATTTRSTSPPASSISSARSARPACAHRGAAQDRQDRDAAEHRPFDRRQSSGMLSDRAADRRAAGGVTDMARR